MHSEIHSGQITTSHHDSIVVGVFQDTEQQPECWHHLDTASNQRLSALLDSDDIATSAGKVTVLAGIDGINQRIFVVGCGKPEKFDALAYRKVALAVAKTARQSPATSLLCCLPELPVSERNAHWKLQTAVLEFAHADYRYDLTKPAKDDAPAAFAQVDFFGADDSTAVSNGLAIAKGVDLARHLGDLPPNLCTPVILAEHAAQISRNVDGVDIEVLDEQQMQELQMNALLAVGQGSANPPRLIVLHYRGGKSDEAPYALVGKGITFDTGGISIKPGANMEQMKYDMCGSATVLGAFNAAARLKLPINLSCVVAAAENMPDGKSYRPGDVITSMSGKTIEVLNTDAEGRMVLCDALTWTERNIKPQAVLDVATLTGACVVALGHHATGIMTKHDDLAQELLEAGQYTQDRAWQLPLWDDYQKQIDSPFADMQNIGGFPAGTITAGCFLSRFTEDMRWAHLDIAGAAWEWGKNVGNTGRPVRLMVQWLQNRADGQS